MSKKQVFRKAALDRLSSPEQLDQLLEVASVRNWILLLGLVTVVGLLVTWSFVGQVSYQLHAQGTLTVDAEAPTDFQAVVFVTAHEASRIQPGMTALVLPAQANHEESGYLEGHVTAVSAAPSLIADMSRTHLREADARRLEESGATYGVSIELTPSTDSPSGYRWTSGRGPGRLQIGAPVSAAIVTERRRPIEMAIPALERVLPSPPS